MRRIIILLFLIVSFAISQDINSKLYEKILIGIFPENEIINIYITDKEEKFDFLNKINIVLNVANANLVLLGSGSYTKELEDKVLFVSNYKELLKYDNAIGALYWKKGRPQIIFLKTRLDKFSIEIDSYLTRYIE